MNSKERKLSKKNIAYLSLISFALIAMLLMTNRNSGQSEPPRPQSIELKVLIPKNYRIVSQTVRDRNAKITFPQLSNLSDRLKQTAINRLIKSAALRISHYNSDADYHLDITYKIKLKSAKLLSVQYSGVGYTPGAAYPNNWFYTTNLDLETGRRLRLKDLVKIDAGLVAKLNSNRGKALSPTQQNFLAALGTKELLKKLRAADPPDWDGGDATFSYLTKDALGISFRVIHALGDHIEFEVDRYH